MPRKPRDDAANFWAFLGPSRLQLLAAGAHERVVAEQSGPQILPISRAEYQALEARLRVEECRRRAERSKLANEAKRLKASRRARRYLSKARKLRKKHPEWSLTSIATELRRRDPTLPSVKTMRRHLKAAGLR